MVPWLIEFLKSGRAERLPAIADAMLNLNRPNLDLYKQLLKGTGHENLIEDCSYVFVTRNKTAMNLESVDWKLRRERGVPIQVITGDEARELEPDLSFRSKWRLNQRTRRTTNPGYSEKLLLKRPLLRA